MKKPLVIISAPVDTFSGYGARSRDLIKAILKCKGEEWNVRVLPQRWGHTKLGYLKEHNEEKLISLLIQQIPSKPKVWFQVTVPNEFQPVGDFNIGVTAAMETTLVHNTWVEGVNRMDLVLTSSEHSKKSLTESVYDAQDNRTGEKTTLKTTKDIEVLFEGVDLETYTSKIDSDHLEIIESLDEIKENFCFLFVGHWLQGEHGHDRKNVGRMIETFLNTFKTQRIPPALVIKTQQTNSCIMDREKILKKIDRIRTGIGGTLPNIYLLHGEINDKEINNLYNHRKIKAMVNLTKGEGFGRPMLEFTTTGKPIIASGWSGHTDYLRSDLNYLVGGKLENVHPSATVPNMILQEAKWFSFDDKLAKDHFKFIFKHYKKALAKGKKQRVLTNKFFTIDKMAEKLNEYIDKYIPTIPIQSEFKPPAPIKIEMPKRKKV